MVVLQLCMWPGICVAYLSGEHKDGVTCVLQALEEAALVVEPGGFQRKHRCWQLLGVAHLAHPKEREDASSAGTMLCSGRFITLHHT